MSTFTRLVLCRSFCCSLLALSLSCSLSGSLSAAQDRVTSAVDTARLKALRGFVHPRATQEPNRGLMDPSTSIAQAMLTLSPAGGLDDFLRAQQTPGSPDYHRWLTPEQFAQRFGPSGNDQAKLVA